ncbi:MAG: hypothetical protein ACTSRP_02045 [Candidatus Helarchaeota archaeon]
MRIFQSGQLYSFSPSLFDSLPQIDLDLELATVSYLRFVSTQDWDLITISIQGLDENLNLISEVITIDNSSVGESENAYSGISQLFTIQTVNFETQLINPIGERIPTLSLEASVLLTIRESEIFTTPFGMIEQQGPVAYIKTYKNLSVGDIIYSNDNYYKIVSLNTLEHGMKYYTCRIEPLGEDFVFQLK